MCRRQVVVVFGAQSVCALAASSPQTFGERRLAIANAVKYLGRRFESHGDWDAQQTAGASHGMPKSGQC